MLRALRRITTSTMSKDSRKSRTPDSKQSKITAFFVKTPPTKPPRSLRLSPCKQPVSAADASTSGWKHSLANQDDSTAEPPRKVAHTLEKIDVHENLTPEDVDATQVERETARPGGILHVQGYAKAEVATEDVTPVASTSVPTAEQRQHIHENYMRALLIRTSRTNPVVPETVGASWFEVLHEEFKKPYFQKLSQFVTEERERKVVYPPAHQVFAWTEHFPIQETKVVILGQDPYHGPGQAHGLSFSVPNGVVPPRSLVNIYQELAKEYPGIVLPKGGNLTGWVRQGVLLLNACLTVRAGEANSHAGHGWEEFTDAVIMWLNEHLTGVVFLLWGRNAQMKGVKINPKRHHVLKAAHPSPLSATKFFGCGHFTQTNELLLKQGKHPIDWSDL
ncbi:hypothetical protein RvY_09015 [Ramazzottius varieornatus]|uniref:Uracil-DNA glycosylase n=1 Tax=Ramazzottius varieornatus TaxID=947166 RepID=A0A1D1V7V3_RAMVA|nr:hypothetical protein RvY_09015 [Ramazzottius varieornatus]